MAEATPNSKTTLKSNPYSRVSDEDNVDHALAISVWEAQEFIREFVQQRWPDHWDLFSIQCNMSLDELQTIGILDRTKGIQACQRIVRVPVISEEVGEALWEKLARSSHTTSSRQTNDEGALSSQSSASASSTSIRSCYAVAGRRHTRSERKQTKEMKRHEQKQKPRCQRKQQQPAAPRSCVFCGGICGHHDTPSSPTSTRQHPRTMFTRLRDFGHSFHVGAEPRRGSDVRQASGMPKGPRPTTSSSSIGESGGVLCLLSGLRSSLVACNGV